MKLTTRILAILIDGESHSVRELTSVCKDIVTPEFCVRNYLRKYQNDIPEGSNYEDQIRLGLHWKMSEIVRQLERRGDITKEFINNQTFVKLTEKGFIACLSPKGRGGKIFNQLRELMGSGKYNIKLVLRGQNELG